MKTNSFAFVFVLPVILVLSSSTSGCASAPSRAKPVQALAMEQWMSEGAAQAKVIQVSHLGNGRYRVQGMVDGRIREDIYDQNTGSFSSDDVASAVAAANASQGQREGASATPTLDQKLDSIFTKLAGQIKDKTGRAVVLGFVAASGPKRPLSDYLTDQAISILTRGGRSMVDRAAIEKVLEEQKFQQSALVDAATAVRLGRLTGAALIVQGKYTEFPDKTKVHTRVLSVETGDVIATVDDELAPSNDLRHLLGGTAAEAP